MPERWLPVDAEGWTLVRPSGDSRLVYVSSSEGDDESAQVYSLSDKAVGEDPLLPTAGIKPYKTLVAAMAQTRKGMPDWVLLKRGDTWWDTRISANHGRSAAEPSVIRAYGRGERPVIRGRKGGVRIGSPKRGVRNAVVMDLVLYCSFLDPEASDYGVDKGEKITRGMASVGMGIFAGVVKPLGANILLENCRFQFDGFSVTGRLTNCVFRRNVVLDKYPPAGHTMGMWGAYSSILLEECIFDHNGWLLQRVPANAGKPGRAIPLSHNTYCTGMYSTIFRDNIFTRAASIHNKFTANQGSGSCREVILDNNLYLDGEIGISMGGNKPGPLRWVDCRIINNVMLDIGLSRPTGRHLAWYVGATDWDGGLIANNLLIHQRSPEVTNVRGLMLGSSGPDRGGEPRVHTRNLTVRDNILHGLASRGYALIVHFKSMQGVRIMDNEIQMPGLGTGMVHFSGDDAEGVKTSGNTYWSDAPRDTWFQHDREPMGLRDWAEFSGEAGATVEKVDYRAPERNIQAYMKQIGMEPNHEAFIKAIRGQSKANWRQELTAPAINAWIREGFGMERSDASKESLPRRREPETSHGN